MFFNSDSNFFRATHPVSRNNRYGLLSNPDSSYGTVSYPMYYSVPAITEISVIVG